MKLKLLQIILFISISFLAFAPGDDERLSKTQVDQTKFTNTGNIGLTLSNFGMFGNGFISYPNYFPSAEYPLGSGIEHLFAGGLWIGGFQKDNINSTSKTGPYVTTGAMDINSLSASSRGGGFEFTNGLTSQLVERSSLLDSRYYSPNAISHQDFVADYTDSNSTFLNGEPIPEHIPYGVSIRQESYAWNFPFADFFVIMNYTIKNVTNKYLDSVYVGLWCDAVVRNIKITPPRGSVFFQYGGEGYSDSMKIGYEYDANSPDAANSYLGLAFLGSTPKTDDFVVTDLDTLFSTNFNSWTHNNNQDPNFFTPYTDNERYRKMQGFFGGNNRYGRGIDPQTLKIPSNRSIMISHGYFRNLAPGDSINVVYAIVCAKKTGDDPSILDSKEQKADLFMNTDWALRAYHGNDRNRNGVIDPGEDIFGDGQIHRYILPSPPNTPIVKVVPENNKATIYFDKRAELSIDPISGNKDFAGYRIYRTQAGKDITGNQDVRGSFVLLAQYDTAGTSGAGYNTGFHAIELNEPKTFPNDTTKYYYKIEVPNLLNGWQYLFSVTSFDKGDPDNNLGSLESSSLANYKRIIPGTPANESPDLKPGVYPNPYYGSALWDGSSERLRKIYFYNLPADCEITIYTLSGDVIKRMDHSASQNGSDIRWFEQFATDNKQEFAGGEHAWDLITDNDQAIATGLYLYTVKNKTDGLIKTGKFLIVK